MTGRGGDARRKAIRRLQDGLQALRLKAHGRAWNPHPASCESIDLSACTTFELHRLHPHREDAPQPPCPKSGLTPFVQILLQCAAAPGRRAELISSLQSRAGHESLISQSAW